MKLTSSPKTESWKEKIYSINTTTDSIHYPKNLLPLLLLIFMLSDFNVIVVRNRHFLPDQLLHNICVNKYKNNSQIHTQGKLSC